MQQTAEPLTAFAADCPGPIAATLICLGAGLLPILLILIIFWIMDWIVRRANQD